MSRENPKYRNSKWQHFAEWCRGNYDPMKGKMEIRPPKRKEEEIDLSSYVAEKKKEKREFFEKEERRRIRLFQKAYMITAIFLGIFLTILLLITVNGLPNFGDAHAPENNEVSKRYIEKGLEETGAVNIVAGMILDYRAFDTFGESCVLFVAACCVLVLLRTDDDKSTLEEAESQSDRYFDPSDDTILQVSVKILAPIIIIFGIYVILNGHISPGGGFSGGAIVGTGLILYLTAFGFENARRFLNEKVIKTVTVCALSFYCFAKSYSFYTGANHLESFITTGTPGAILSAGLIVYLNACVGIVVACTIYSFYVMFRRGGF